MNGHSFYLLSWRKCLSVLSLGLGVVHFFAARKAGEEQADRFSDLALLAIWPVMGLGFVASLLHLGNPMNAYRAVTNLDSSWLSREILFGILFCCRRLRFCTFAMAQGRQLHHAEHLSLDRFHLWSWLGLQHVKSLYAADPAFPGTAWLRQSHSLPPRCCWGALALGVAFVVSYSVSMKKDPTCAEAQCELLRGALRWIAIATVVLLGVELVTIPIYIGTLSASGSAVALTSTSMLLGEFGLVFALRLILVFVGAGIFGYFLVPECAQPRPRENAGKLCLRRLCFGAGRRDFR